MLRVDQVQRYIARSDLSHSIALRMNYKHLDWISKDTDMQADHWEKHTLSWEVPDTPFDFDGWAIDIASKLEAESAYEIYNPTLNSNKGLILIYGARIVPSPNVPSGFIVAFTYTYIDPTLALM